MEGLKMRKTIASLVLMAMLGAPVAARAQDPGEEVLFSGVAMMLNFLYTPAKVALATGGLVLTRNADIALRSEDLYISLRQVRVSYRFRNTAPTDVKALMAFPMPDIRVADAAASIPLPTDDPENLLGFSTRVDGTPVKAQVMQKVFAGGADRTADLDRLKVPLAPHLRSTNMALGRNASVTLLVRVSPEGLVEGAQVIESDVQSSAVTAEALRVAMGARPRDVTLMILRQGGRVAGVGLAVGLAAAVAASGLVEALLFDMSPTDPATYAVVALGLLAVSLLASWLPARRAARLDPVTALRSE